MVIDIHSRMKIQYEDRVRYYLPRRTWTVVRVDGKAFHSLLARADRPFDLGFISVMNLTAQHLCGEMQGVRFAYVQSDEISVLLTDFETITTEAWFDGNLQKIVSISSSIATAWFNHFSPYGWIQSGSLAYFDARAFTIPDPYEVENYFISRQKDAERNSIQMLAQAYYSPKELLNKKTPELHEMLFVKGVNWNDLDVGVKRGRVCLADAVLDVPIFTQERDFLRGRIPVLKGFSWETKDLDENN